MNKEILEKILIKAVHAPSGENAQPWRFEVTQDYSIFLYCIASRDASIYNLDNIAAYVAFGALIENIVLVSSSFGFSVTTELFPHETEELCIAKIVFEVTTVPPLPLEEYILKRHSNRQAFLPTSFSHEFLTSLQECHHDMSAIKVHTTTHKHDIQRLSEALSLNDFLALYNTTLSKFLFSHIIFESSDGSHRNIGLPLSTLGLDFVDCLGLTFVHRLRFPKLFRFLHVPTYVAHKSALRIQTASLVGCITVTSETNSAYIEVGRTLQRIWLRATQENISLQVFGIPLIHRAISISAHSHIFSDFEKEKITHMYNDIGTVYHLEKEVPVIMFRLGVSDHQVPHTEKMPPKIKYL